MENKIVNLEVKNNFDELVKDVKKLNSGLEESTKEVKKLEKNVEKTEDSAKSLSEGFKAAGLAIKAMGIGLLISALSMLKDVFMSNQKVADTFGAVMGTITNVFTQVVNVLVSVIEKVGKSSNGFSALGKVISGIITLSLTPLKAAFYGISLAIDEAKLAWEQSFFGDGDPKVISELNKRIEGTKESLIQVGKDALEAGKKVATNFVGAVKEVGAVVEGTIDGVSKISVKAAYEQAKANVQLQNNAKIAAAEQAKLVEKYGIDAEKLRKIRDNDLLSVEDRIKANNDLKDVLDKQQSAMLKQANLQVQAAQSTYSANKTLENQVELINAKKDALGVLNQIEGLTSEQESNRVALKKELEELNQSEIQGINDLAIEKKKFDEELEKDEVKKLQKQRANLEEEKNIKLLELQNNINVAALGTQARVDAELEYKTKKQEIDNALILNAVQTKEKILEQEKAIADGKKAIQEQTIATVESGLNLLKNIFAGNEDVQKGIIIAESAVGIAKMIIANNIANVAALATPQAIATSGAAAVPVIALNNISTGIGIAANIAATSKALSALGGGGAPSSGGAGATGGTGGAAPQFNVVGQGGANQIAQGMAQQNMEPIQAYVVAGAVTTGQALNRNIINNASMG
jgi:hypothetical protein